MSVGAGLIDWMAAVADRGAQRAWLSQWVTVLFAAVASFVASAVWSDRSSRLSTAMSTQIPQPHCDTSATGASRAHS
jgi:hypothetical protein